MLQIKNSLLAAMVSSVIFSASLNAGTMGSVNTMGESGKFMLVEGGYSYMRALYLNSPKFPRN